MMEITVVSTIASGMSSLVAEVIASVAALPTAALLAALGAFALGISGIVVAQMLGNPGSPGSAKQGRAPVAMDLEAAWLAQLREAA